MRTTVLFFVLSAIFTGCGFDQGIQREYIISESNVEEVASSITTEADSEL